MHVRFFRSSVQILGVVVSIDLCSAVGFVVILLELSTEVLAARPLPPPPVLELASRGLVVRALGAPVGTDR